MTDGVGLYISSFRAQVRIRMERSDQIASTCKHYWFCIITNMKDLMFRIFKIHKVVLSKALLLTASLLVGPVWARGNPFSPLSLQFPTSPSSTVSFSIFFFLFSISYLLYLFSWFLIPSHSTRIVPLHFQVGCRRRRLNLALVFLC